MIERIADLVVRRPWWFIVTFVVIALVLASQIPRATVDPEIKNQLPADMPTRVNLDRIEELFGGTEIVILAVGARPGVDVLQAETLKRIKGMSRAMERMKGVEKVVSLFTLKDIRAEDGAMIVDPAVRRIPKTENAREALRARLKDNELVYGSVVSKDWSHAAIIGLLSFDAEDAEAIEALRAIVREHPGEEVTEIAGMPMVRAELAKDIPGDMRKFMPAGLLIMLVFLFVAFRQLRGVLLPFVVTVMAVAVSMGLIPLLGWKIAMLTVILPVILLAVANDYGIHMFARYQEMNHGGSQMTKRELARDGIVHLAKPVMATAITTVAGLMCLLSHVIIPAEQMGWLASVGVLYALAASLLFIPALLAVLPRAKPVLGSSQSPDGGDAVSHESWLERGLRRTAVAVTRHPKGVLLGTVIFVGALATGIGQIVVDTNSANYYPPGAPVPRAMNLVNENFGGAAGISIVAEGDVKSPEVMGAIDDFERHLLKNPRVDITSSIARVVRRMSRVMHDGMPDSGQYDRIPDNRDEIAQYFLLYDSSGDPEDFDRLVDFPYRHAQLVARVNDTATSSATEVVEDVRAYMEAHPDAPFTVIGGFADLFAALVDHVVYGQLASLLLSLTLVGLLVGLLFRAVLAGIFATIPLALSMLLLFGLMGHTGVELNIATAMLSSIMIGVGVDYTIHFMWRYRTERASGMSASEAVVTTLTTTGRGIVFNALSVVVGFAVLMLSSFLPVRFFGVLVVVSISACLVGALVVLPALTLVFRPRFLEGKLPSQVQDVTMNRSPKETP